MQVNGAHMVLETACRVGRQCLVGMACQAVCFCDGTQMIERDSARCEARAHGGPESTTASWRTRASWRRQKESKIIANTAAEPRAGFTDQLPVILHPATVGHSAHRQRLVHKSAERRVLEPELRRTRHTEDGRNRVRSSAAYAVLPEALLLRLRRPERTAARCALRVGERNVRGTLDTASGNAWAARPSHHTEPPPRRNVQSSW
ncbi:hypothetical protein FA95DRAFT_579043 [Auriscalpium vulgare]|uniref:Uncharacterized protein n=1 Tax=Auriscalpium vulgare TaxID=40419 RepID=A0ACB8S4C2_9AGAM|nr:hypothetical protein FA95DRAFT_579043 [Auriscalpium vulgare]